jgi:phage-related protein (TIGR01555 family)
MILDSFRNLVSGLMGTARDKTVAVEAVFTPIDPMQIEALYRGNAMARKIVEIPPADMCREGRAWSLEDEDISAIDRTERRFGVWGKVEQALILARQYGGAVIIIGTGDRPEIPLTQVRRGGLQYLTVLNRYQVGEEDLERDPISPRYGLPTFYSVAGSRETVRVHHSRIIHVRGQRGLWEDAWGDSVFETLRDPLIHLGMVSQNAAHLVGESKIDVITMPGIAEASDTMAGRTKVLERFALGAQVRGIYSTLLLGEGEEYEQKTINLGGLPDIMDAFAQALCAAADIPAPRLLGRHPGGLNSTGDADIRNYYDRIAADQEKVLRPLLDQLDAVLWQHTFGRPKPEDAWFDFRPLWQMSEKEQAEVSAIRAKTVQTYFDTGLIPEPVLQVGTRHMLSEDGMFPGIEKTWDEFDAGTLEGFTLPEPENDDEEEAETAPILRAANDKKDEDEPQSGS